MTDLTIFFIGMLVSLVVASAVGLLFWGAAHEERGTLLPRSWTEAEPESAESPEGEAPGGEDRLERRVG